MYIVDCYYTALHVKEILLIDIMVTAYFSQYICARIKYTRISPNISNEIKTLMLLSYKYKRKWLCTYIKMVLNTLVLYSAFLYKRLLDYIEVVLAKVLASKQDNT